MQFTFYGHACFAVEVEGKKLLFDPFISPNEKASAINVIRNRRNNRTLKTEINYGKNNRNIKSKRWSR